MISIIVCSVDNLLFERFSQSVSDTIGVPYEVLSFDNRIDRLSIATVYNNAAKAAVFKILVFVHEDVVFHTINWGKKLVSYFAHLDRPGVLGVAGSSYLPISPSDWWLCDPNYLHANFISNKKNGRMGEGYLKKWGEQMAQPVFALDGMFLAMKKSVWKDFHFNEDLYGFQGYDTSICYRVSQKYQNYFIPGILMEHFSKGCPNSIWLINTVKANESIAQFLKKIRKDQKLDRNLEVKAYHLFLNQLAKYSNRWIFNFRYSFIYGWEITKCFFSFRTIYLWLVFQVLYFTKIIKK
ncbi:hypothetical protein J0A68_18435 [Algoriphagus sp. H41]|uniref:Streptomycin biosynthesis protein StrF domain-containing protein n=1 Tax=Algoriphagus oliviformis TaxID=2811231 RepID=A0ABS3C9V0_9BACT|nr:glycosyltransferase [Algoriphagus oliviformis]MBN7812941.1 hypothetical protein [Algoriphagus oliviformis]